MSRTCCTLPGSDLANPDVDCDDDLDSNVFDKEEGCYLQVAEEGVSFDCAEKAESEGPPD